MFVGTPQIGFIKIKLGDFEGCASYVNDVPLDCLDAMIYALKNKTDFIVSFDAEGWTFKIIADEYRCFIIELKNEPILYTVELDIYELAEKICNHIEQYLEEWIVWSTRTEDDEIYHFKQHLISSLNELQQIIK